MILRDVNINCTYTVFLKTKTMTPHVKSTALIVQRRAIHIQCVCFATKEVAAIMNVKLFLTITTVRNTLRLLCKDLWIESPSNRPLGNTCVQFH